MTKNPARMLITTVGLAGISALAACTVEDDISTYSAPQTEYSALGQEPGWALRIDSERMTYTGDYGDTVINVARPAVVASASGERYATRRLTVDIVASRCFDAMSGSGFEDQVTVNANGKIVRGCGGQRLPEPGF